MFAAINSYIHTPVITINGDNYSLEFFLCADYKVHPMQCTHCNLQLYVLAAITLNYGVEGSNS